MGTKIQNCAVPEGYGVPTTDVVEVFYVLYIILILGERAYIEKDVLEVFIVTSSLRIIDRYRSHPFC